MLALLAACTASGPAFQPLSQRPSGQGIVYVYRPQGEAVGRGETPYIEIAGKNMGMLKAGGYISLTLPPGEHEVTVRQAMLFVPTLWDTVTIAVAPGSVSYIRVDQRVTRVGNAGFFSAMQQVFIEEVSAETGQNEIADTKQN
jgi:hypothetical protein